MASSTDVTSAIYKWVDKKPLTEAVSWSSREKFWLITAAYHYGINDWKSVAQVVKNAGEPYRPKEWYSPKNCERQFKILISNLNKEIRSLPFMDMMQNIAEGLKIDYIRDSTKSRDALKAKYCSLFGVMTRLKQGNLSRNEIFSLYSQARRHEIESIRYVEQLMTRQNASLASENSSSGLSDEPIKWNTPSAPLLTSLLRSRNTIPGNRAVTSIGSLLQSPGGSSRTRSGKLLPLSPTAKVTQGTPTLSKLLEAPANPYISSPPQLIQKNRQCEDVEEDKLVGNTSKKENLQSFSLNKVRVDNQMNLVSFNQINKADLSFSKRQPSKNVLPEVNNGSKANSNIVNLLSDSENDDDTNSFQDILPKNIFDENNDINIISRLEPRATRSQTRAEGGSLKHLNISKLFDGKKNQEISRQESGEIQMTETHSIDSDDLIDIDQIDIEPLPSIQDEVIVPTSKITRSSMLRPRVNNSTSIINKGNSKEINNQMLEEISANFVLSSKNVGTEYTNVLVGQSRIDNSNISGCLIPVDASTVKDALLLCKDNQSFSNSGNTLATFNGKLIKQKRVIEIKPANLKCIDARKEHKFISFANQPIVVVNKIKKPFNIKLAPELKDKTDDINVMTNDPKKNLKQLHSNPQNVVQLLDAPCSISDEVIVIDDDVNINVDEPKSIESNKVESQNLLLATVTSNNSINSNSKAIKSYQSGNKKAENDKTQWKVFGKHQSLSNISFKKSDGEDSDHKVGISSNIKDTNNRFIKELEFDFDQSISETSLSELYNGVEEVEMHSFDNEELNSLIECGSLDNNVTEKRQNAINMDQGDSSVSESDSNIGAFDTFAQITRVSQKSSSKDTVSINRELKIVKQDGKGLRRDEGFVRADGHDDDQTSALSVTGIPVLQGVISDVMSKIDSDRVAALKTVGVQNVSSDDIVEISSDEEEEKAKSKVNDFSKICEPGTKIVHGVNNKFNKINMIEKSISKDITIIRPIMNFKNHTFNLLKKSAAKEIESTYSKQNLDLLEANKNNIETMVMKYTDDNTTRANKKKVEERESEVKKKKELELKVIEKKLQCEEIIKNIKDTEEIKKLEAEEIKKKEAQEKIKIENEVNKKKEDEERKKKEEDERRKKEDEERKKNEAEEKRIKDDEQKKIIEVEEKRIKEDEQKNKIEVEEKKKKDEDEYKMKNNEDKKIKDDEERKIKDEEKKKIKDKERMKKEDDEKNKIKKGKDFQEAEKKTFEAEIMKRVETAEIAKSNNQNKINQEFETENNKLNNVSKKAKISEMSEEKDSKTKQIEEIHVPVIDIRKLKTSELLKLAKEAKLVEAVTEDDIKRAQEAMKSKEKAKEAELRKIEEVETQEAKEVEIQKAKEIELKKNKELDYKKSKDDELKRDKEKDLKRAKFEKMKQVKFECMIRRAEEEVNTEEVGSRKVMDTDIKDKEDEKAKEVEINIKNDDPVSKLRGDKKNIEEQPKKSKKSERLVETRKNYVKETGNKETGTTKLKEQELKRNVEIEAKQTKETENKTAEVKIISRTRGSKAEEKHKQYLEAVNPSTIKDVTNKFFSSLKYNSSAIFQNFVNFSNNDCRKSIKNIDGDNHNMGSKSKVDLGKKSSERDSNEINIKEDIQQEITCKSRTRSSLTFKSGKAKETKSKSLNLSNEQNIVGSIPKCNTGSKTKIETSSSSPSVNHQLGSEISKDKFTSKPKFGSFSTKSCCIRSIHLLDSSKDLKYMLDLTTVKQLENNDKQPNKTDINEKPEVLAPKKRGRKRRINNLNNIQPVNSDVQTLPISASPSNVGEPLAKRTRSSLELHKNESNDHIFTKPKKCKKNKLKRVLNHICKKKSKQVSAFQKKINGLESPISTIIKKPVDINHIKRQINTGNITQIDDLRVNLFMLSYNFFMVNNLESPILNSVLRFQKYINNFNMKKKSAFNDTNVNAELVGANSGTSTHENNDSSEYSRDNVLKNKDAANKKAVARLIKNLGSVVEPNLSSSLPPKKRRRRNISSNDPNIDDPEISC